jgi:hypothetical protein
MAEKITYAVIALAVLWIVYLEVRLRYQQKKSDRAYQVVLRELMKLQYPGLTEREYESMWKDFRARCPP